jgi:hypothetical protein
LHNPGPQKRERERAMVVLHSFIPFISSLTFSHHKMLSIQKWPIKLPTKETQLRSKSGFFSVFQYFFDIENCQIFPKISRNYTFLIKNSKVSQFSFWKNDKICWWMKHWSLEVFQLMPFFAQYLTIGFDSLCCLSESRCGSN